MNEKPKIGVEIEKKYIISRPLSDELLLMDEYRQCDIVQIYLPTDDGSTHRVRKSCTDGKVTFTETRKIRIDKMSSTEIEGEISETRFAELSGKPKQGTRPINKTRHSFLYLGQLFEIDVYPEWERTAILETELDSRDRQVEFPVFLRILRDVTGDRRYSNAAMSRDFPEEELLV